MTVSAQSASRAALIRSHRRKQASQQRAGLQVTAAALLVMPTLAVAVGKANHILPALATVGIVARKRAKSGLPAESRVDTEGDVEHLLSRRPNNAPSF